MSHAAPSPDKSPLLRRVASGVIVTFLGCIGIYVLLLLILGPVQTGPHSGSRRTECKNHLKQIALALHNYHDEYGCFPPAYVADKHGRPMHSWRVLLLPFLEFKLLYEKYRFDEPWDGPHNRDLASERLDIFRCPADEGPNTNTSYLVVVGPKTVFPGTKTVKISEITSGTSNTILLVEVVNSGIKWTEPRDLSDVEAIRGINPKSGFGISSHHEGGAQIAFADGTVRFFLDDTPPDHLQSFLDRDADKLELRLPAN